MFYHLPWIEKYKPQHIDEIVIPISFELRRLILLMRIIYQI